jgi:dTDP-4-dehydrorhamnose reductase
MFAINAVFPQHLAALGARYGFRLITISTDCVFAGDRGMYTEADLSDARDLYGISKFLGEAREGNCLTLRTSIIGRELGTRHSIVEWFLANRGGQVKGFTRAIYTGFPTVVFAEIIGDVIEKNSDMRGLYHVSDEPVSKFDLLTLINRHFDAGITIDPDETYAIDRSLDSTLFRRAVGFAPAPWDEMIGLMAADPTPYDNWSAINAVA